MQDGVGAATAESPIGTKQDDGAGAFALQHDLNARIVHWVSMSSIGCAHAQEEMAERVNTLGKDGDGKVGVGEVTAALTVPWHRLVPKTATHIRVRVQLIGHFKPCTTEIYLHIVARMAD